MDQDLSSEQVRVLIREHPTHTNKWYVTTCLKIEDWVEGVPCYFRKGSLSLKPEYFYDWEEAEKAAIAAGFLPVDIQLVASLDK